MPFPADNLAYMKPTNQSSDYDGKFESYRAVDGNVDPDNTGGESCAHTDNDAHSWWSVDLGSTHRIREVDVFNKDHNSKLMIKLLN